MKNLFAVAVVLVCAGIVSGQKHTITEVKHSAPVPAAPRECMAVFHAFFNYLQYAKPDIISDEQAQKRFLTEALRKALAQRVATFKTPNESPDYPSNNSFIGAWDLPTSYAILSTRRYGTQAIIDLVYKWGPKTNYPGDVRVVSFVFQLEGAAWKLDDIYNFRGEFAPPGSLHQYFVEK